MENVELKSFRECSLTIVESKQKPRTEIQQGNIKYSEAQQPTAKQSMDPRRTFQGNRDRTEWKSAFVGRTKAVPINTINTFLRKEENFQINNLSSHLKKLEKEEQNNPKANIRKKRRFKQKAMKIRTKSKRENP